MGSMLQRKGGDGPCQEESPWFLLPFTPCFSFHVHSQDHGSLLTLNLDGFSPPATRIREPTQLPCKHPLPPHNTFQI